MYKLGCPTFQSANVTCNGNKNKMEHKMEKGNNAEYNSEINSVWNCEE